MLPQKLGNSRVARVLDEAQRLERLLGCSWRSNMGGDALVRFEQPLDEVYPTGPAYEEAYSVATCGDRM